MRRGKGARRSGERWLSHRVSPEEQGRTVREILKGPLGISGRMLQRLSRRRGFLLDGRPCALVRRVSAGEVVSVRIAAPEKSNLESVAMPLSIPFEDDDLLVVDKPAGLPIHPTKPGEHRTLANAVAYHFEQKGERRRIRPVHRLDRGTSGLVLIAKHEYAHQRLAAQLEAGAIERSYLACVEGIVTTERGVIELPIGRHPRAPHLRAVRQQGGKPAKTSFTVVARASRSTLLRLTLETGRTHQIRVHLAAIGHPIVGDAAYGARRLPPSELRKFPALHAASLTFRHPLSGEEHRYESPLPEDFRGLLTSIEDQIPRLDS